MIRQMRNRDSRIRDPWLNFSQSWYLPNSAKKLFRGWGKFSFRSFNLSKSLGDDSVALIQ